MAGIKQSVSLRKKAAPRNFDCVFPRRQKRQQNYCGARGLFPFFETRLFEREPDRFSQDAIEATIPAASN
jgi:hypothetical protein